MMASGGVGLLSAEPWDKSGRMLTSRERGGQVHKWGFNAWEEVMAVVVMETTRGWEDVWERYLVLLGCATCCWRVLMLDNGRWF